MLQVNRDMKNPLRTMIVGEKEFTLEEKPDQGRIGMAALLEASLAYQANHWAFPEIPVRGKRLP
jgi:hypothetical protein